VPVGLISSNWGGKPAEAWTRLEDLTRNSDLAFYLNNPNKNDSFPAMPGVLFNAMIHPLIQYPTKGVIWYQGESNRNDAQLYHMLMGTLICALNRREGTTEELPSPAGSTRV
jgi:sialate O-acetylesterase